MSSPADMQMPTHHRQHEVALNRPAYREGRKFKAVKVYTVAHESRYLIVQRVAAIGLQAQLASLLAQYGNVRRCEHLGDYPVEEQFTQTYLVEFDTIWHARVAKSKLDEHEFYGNKLHVAYAPEYETVEECRAKLLERTSDVRRFLSKLNTQERAQCSRDEMEQQQQQQEEQSVEPGAQAEPMQARPFANRVAGRIRNEVNSRGWNRNRAGTQSRYANKHAVAKIYHAKRGQPQVQAGRTNVPACTVAVALDCTRVSQQSEAVCGRVMPPIPAGASDRRRPAMASGQVKDEVRKRLKIIFRNDAAKRAKTD